MSLKIKYLTIKKLSAFLLCVFSFTLAACSGLFDKDNTPPPSPLTVFKAEIMPRQLWGVDTGGGGTRDYLKLSLTSSADSIFVVSLDGNVTMVNKRTGRVNWRVATGLPLRAGAGYGYGLVVVGSNKGDVLALSKATGKQVWAANMAGSILAQPAVGNGIVVIKTADGLVHGLSTANGQESWTYHETEPNLILHSASTPVIRDNDVLVGFANGNLVRLGLSNGQLRWQQGLAIPQGAFAIQRMIDVDADPIVFEHRVYAATYQGTIASLEWSNGRQLWNHDISSYSGMAADDTGVYISDAKSYVWALGTDSGLVNWRQTQLANRNISGPAIMGRYVVVGDEEGYIHWMSKRDGHFAGRVYIGASIFAPPLVENNVLYACTKNGYLVAYKI